MKYPVTRKEAKSLNSKYYFTGLPCKHGHIAPRVTKGACTECQKVDWKKQIEKRKGQPTSEAGKRSQRKYYEKNRDRVIARAIGRPNNDKQRYRKRWKLNHPEANNAWRNAWRRRQKDACPPWISKEDKQKINDLYKEAYKISKATGERYIVDHIVPIFSKVVCGLHAPWNLRVITNLENSRKSNIHKV